MNIPTQLYETSELMTSANYAERFLAEYYQLVIRRDKLKNMLTEWDNGTLGFQPTCPREIYDEQLKAMNDYSEILVRRAVIEKVELI